MRTYVKHPGRVRVSSPAKEWLPNAAGVFIGPPHAGLPYRYGRLDYRYEHERGEPGWRWWSAPLDQTLRYLATVDAMASYETYAGRHAHRVSAGALTARSPSGRGVCGGGSALWHEPWSQAPAEAVIEEASLIAETGPWFERAT